jgi:hypothetical protein
MFAFGKGRDHLIGLLLAAQGSCFIQMQLEEKPFLYEVRKRRKTFTALR